MKFLKQSLLAASVITISVSMISRFLGYFREAFIAKYFGTDSIIDIFWISFTFPEFIYFIAFASLPTALIPALKEFRKQHSINERSLFLTGFFLFSAIFGILLLLSFIFRNQILHFTGPGLIDSEFDMGIKIYSIVVFVMFFTGIESYFRSWLYEKKHFIIPVASMIILNIVILSFLFLLQSRYGIMSLAIGWLSSSVIIFIVNGIFIMKFIKRDGPFKFSLQWTRLLLKSVLIIAVIQMLPFLYTPLDRYLASLYLNSGSIAALKYATILNQLPISVFIVAFNLVVFPWITDYVSENNMEKLQNIYSSSIKLISFIIGFTSIGILLFSTEIISIAFLRGRFDIVSLNLTKGPLMFYTFAALFYSFQIFIMRIYYAKRALLRLGVILTICLSSKMIFSYLLIDLFQHSGLALATAISWSLGFLIMAFDMSRKFKLSNNVFISKDQLKLTFILFTVAILWIALKIVWPYNSNGNTIETAIRLFFIGMSGTALYLFMAYKLELSEPRKLFDNIKKRIFN